MANFNRVEFVADVIRQIHNRIVREDLDDVLEEVGDGTMLSPRQALLQACLFKDEDSLLLNTLQSNFYNLTLKKSGLDNPTALHEIAFIGLLSTATVFRHPQIFLYFRQDIGAVPPGEDALEAEVSFRLLSETHETFTPAKALPIAQRVKAELGQREGGYQGLSWGKGKTIASYRAKEEGMELRLYCHLEAEAEDLIRRVCRIASVPFRPEKLSYSTPRRDSENRSVEAEQIYSYGKRVRVARFRPMGRVRFRYAVALVYGQKKPIPLFDLTNHYGNPLATSF